MNGEIQIALVWSTQNAHTAVAKSGAVTDQWGRRESGRIEIAIEPFGAAYREGCQQTAHADQHRRAVDHRYGQPGLQHDHSRKLPVREHWMDKRGTESEVRHLIQEASHEAMLTIEIGWTIRTLRISLIVAQKIQVQRGDAPGTAGVVQRFRKSVAGLEIQSVPHPLRQAGLQ